MKVGSGPRVQAPQIKWQMANKSKWIGETDDELDDWAILLAEFWTEILKNYTKIANEISHRKRHLPCGICLAAPDSFYSKSVFAANARFR